ncbi:capsule biosynthesis protein [Echinicola strongylocentroti]|uniref:Capsule biosynthesis protein n=1 Tax=Echinicola strongylocentroti TaxID=1795355 RepID=A0A2Z4IIU4_9BACT|nr:SLBB domain-containing protein [Echinicola strongylocentroti]AWW30610.1 capsule biosynthesis protein [Echinicola strongylocentroti]
MIKFLNLVLVQAMMGLALLLAVPQGVNAQSMSDVATIKVDELSDDQVRTLLQKAKDAGLSNTELLEMARSRGMANAEVEKLAQRIEQVETSSKTGKNSSTLANRKPRQQANQQEIQQGFYAKKEQPTEVKKKDSYFGLDLFYQKDRQLTFEPNLNMATPDSYVLGPGDLVYVDVYGASENYYESTVTPEGNLLLENIGPIGVSGLSIAEATRVIKNRLSRFYADMQGDDASTFMQISLGNVRSIKVHLVGELRLPGTFTLSAFSTVFNALYAAGGPTKNGTMRNIKVMRNNKQVATVDAYDFLVNGKANMDLQLQDQDVILVEPYQSRVTLQGAVKRPMVFEVKGDESFADVLDYAGGFTDNAYKDKISVTRITDKEKTVSDVYNGQFDIFTVKAGDHYTVGTVLDRYNNRVQLKGAVFREGNYALSDGLTLSQLIARADGLRGDAYLDRASILRTHDDLSTSVIQVDLKEVMNGTEEVYLEEEDIVRISSIYDLKDEYYLKISGEVRDPGIYPYSTEMTVEDLIQRAGGFTESASKNDVEIARRILEDRENGEIADLIPVEVNPDLDATASSITLAPYDNIIVRRKPNFALERIVMVEGQVNAPGEFALRDTEERISDVISRAGGLTGYAYPAGATLIRRTEYYHTESEKLRKQKNLEKLLDRIDNGDPSEAQARQMRRLERETQDSLSEQEKRDLIAQSRQETLHDIGQGEGTAIKIKETEAIAIDLNAIIEQPGSKYDLILEEGDIISVPKQLQTVRMRGDVIYPTTVRHEDFRSMKYYIDRAGGFDNRANRKRTYVVYANGEVARTKSFLGLKSYPRIEPGSEVIVPSKGPRVPLRIGEIIGLTSGLATLALVISQINFDNGSGN